jgi:hypothetical protein
MSTLTEMSGKRLPVRAGATDSTVIEDTSPNRRRRIVDLPSGAPRSGRTTQLASLTIIFQSVAVSPVASLQTMLPQSPRPRAADDFDAIRARMEELRRERGRVTVDDNSRRVDRPRQYAVSSRLSLANRAVFPPAIMRRLSRR